MFEIDKANILAKVQFLDQYLTKVSTQQQEKNKEVNYEEVDEEAFMELSSEFEEDMDLSQLGDAVDKLYSTMDFDENNRITNSELSKFSNILQKVGLSADDILKLYEMYDKEVTKDVATDSDEITDANSDSFKEVISQYPQLQELVNQIGYEKFFEMLDTNKDGILSKSEIAAMSNSNGKLDSIVSADIKNEPTQDNDNIFSSLGNLFRDYAKDYQNLITNAVNQVQNFASNAIQSITGSTGANISQSSPATTRATTNASTAFYKTTQIKQVSNEDKIAELEAQKSEKEGEIQDNTNKLANIQNGTDETVAQAKADMDEAEAEYKELLESEAESNEQVRTEKEKLEQTEQELEENETAISDKENEINETKIAVAEKTNEVSSLESEKSALESSLSAAKATEVNENNKEEVNSKIEELEEKISAKEQEIETAKGELEELEQKQADQEKELEELKNTNETLKETRNQIEENLKTMVSETTKAALEKYQNLRDTYESTKDQAISETKETITTLQTQVQEIVKQINELKAEDIEKENQISPHGKYDAKTGEALAKNSAALYGNRTTSSSRCATGVADAIQATFGFRTHGNGCDYGNVMAGLDGWTEITDTISSVKDLQNLPAGCVISWSAYGSSGPGSLYGHVCITQGDGTAVSDFKENISDYYLNRGSQFRVFMPT